MEAQQVAESLKSDPFFIDESVADSLDVRLLDKAKSTAEGLDFDVYVIAVNEDAIDRDLLQQIKVFNGGEGSFIMINDTTGLAVEVYFEDSHDLEMQVLTQLSNAHANWNVSTPSTTKLNLLLDLYAHPEAAKEAEEPVTGQEVPGSDITQDSNSGSFAPMLFGGAVLALVIAGIYLARTIRVRAAEHRKQHQFRLPGKPLDRGETLQLKSLRDDINSDTAQIAEEIDRLQTQNLDSANAAKVELALDAYQIARRIVDDEGSERIDLAGANGPPAASRTRDRRGSYVD